MDTQSILKSNSNSSNNDNKKINIETLRLVDLTPKSSCDICNNKSIIDACNLNKSLKNFVAEVDMVPFDSLSGWKKSIEAILNKRYYHKLANVNL